MPAHLSLGCQHPSVDLAQGLRNSGQAVSDCIHNLTIQNRTRRYSATQLRQWSSASRERGLRFSDASRRRRATSVLGVLHRACASFCGLYGLARVLACCHLHNSPQGGLPACRRAASRRASVRPSRKARIGLRQSSRIFCCTFCAVQHSRSQVNSPQAESGFRASRLL